MLHRLNVSKSLGGLLCLGLLITPAFAHEVEVSGDVGGTLHIEPHDNPEAGRTSQVWIALTRKGGEILPLGQCNCQLIVHPEPHAEGASPLIKPPLKAVSAGQYQGIPGAEIVFPKQGEYELELRGTPKAGANFKPFALKFPVTVALGVATAASAPQTQAAQTAPPDGTNAQPHQVTQQPGQLNSPWRTPVIVITALLGLGLIGLELQRQRHTN